MKAWIRVVLAGLVALSGKPGIVRAESTSFIYVGQFTDLSAPAHGSYDFSFGLYASVAGGSPLAAVVTNSSVLVSNGVFATTLDFGNMFDGTDRWLEIGVRTNGATNGFVILTPRQPVTHVPNAMHAMSASSAAATTGPIADGQLSANIARLNGSATFTGTVSAAGFTGNGSGLTGLNALTLTNLDQALPTAVQNPPVLNAGAQLVQTLTYSNRPARILLLGDSMSEKDGPNYSASSALIDKLFRIYGYAGTTFRNIDLNYPAPGPVNPCLFRRGPETTDPYNSNFPLFFTLGADLYPDGLSVRAPQGVTTRTNAINLLGLWWFATTNGGNLQVVLTNSETGGRTFLLNGYSTTSVVRYTNWPTVLSSDNAIYMTSLAGTNIVVGTEMVNTNISGIEEFFYAQGGSGIMDITAPGIPVMASLFQSVHPDIVIWHGINRYGESDAIYASLLTQMLVAAQGGSTNCPAIIIGAPTAPNDNALRQAIVATNTANNFYYLDLAGKFPDEFAMMRAGILWPSPTNAINPHPTPAGALAWASEMYRELGF